MINFLISLLLFLGTTEFFPHWIALGSIPLIYISERRHGFVFNSNHKLLALIVFLCLLNETVGLSFGNINNSSFLELFPYLFLIFATLFISSHISDKVVKWIIVLILFEISIGVLQYLLGIKTFTNPSLISDVNNSLLYDKHVFGISGNSSGFAFKVFLCLLIFHYNETIIKINKKLMLCFIIVGLLITFNRTIIVASVFFFLLFFHYNLKNKIWTYRNFFSIALVALPIILFLVISYEEYIVIQFLRGSETISAEGNSLSERDVVYKYFWNFISENPFFGNHSFKYHYYSMGKIYHAHNSYLQLFANNGVIIGSIFILFIVKNINKTNYIYVLPILFTGLLQYSIFWGISFTDIWFYYFLLIPNTRIIRG